MSILRLARYTNVVLTSGFTAYLVYTKMNNFSKCREMLEEKKDKSFLLPPPVKILVNEVLSEMKLKKEDISQINIFFSETTDFVRHGTVNQPNGALLGIPHYFLIDEITDITLSTVDEKNKITNVREPQNLEESMHLSYQAKKFAIARELYELIYSNHTKLYSLPLLVNLKFVFTSYLIEKFSKRKNIRTVHLLFHLALFLMGAVCSALTYDLVNFYTETNADFSACDLGKSYINGGIEYYSKMIKKNKALKKIDKNAPYSKNGDINYSLFGKHHMSLQKRLIYLRDLNSKKEKPSVWDYILFAY